MFFILVVSGLFVLCSLQISFTCILFPSVALCYTGQTAYLRKFPENVSDTFYKSIPGTHPSD
jgi:KUP system potassium uptake protein